ncbi:MAG: hypothetical protein AB7L76_07175 [Burkholderiaceae bacterium]
MFEPGLDQAAGLRRLFEPARPLLLPLACATGDAADRHAAHELARALARLGHRPLLLDLLGPLQTSAPSGFAVAGASMLQPAVDRDIVRVDARWLLDGGDARDLGRLLDETQRRQRARGQLVDVAVVAAPPLRLADLSAGLTDRLLLLAPGDAGTLPHTYSQIKAIGLAHGLARWLAVFRDAPSRRDALSCHQRLASAATRFLGAAVEFGGTVAFGAFGAQGWDALAGQGMRWAASGSSTRMRLN